MLQWVFTQTHAKLMTTYFVSRHPGAIQWAELSELAIDQFVPHLDTAQLRPGDTVIGTLPVHLAAEVCARGAEYINLTLDLPAYARGRELCVETLTQFGARLERFIVQRSQD